MRAALYHIKDIKEQYLLALAVRTGYLLADEVLWAGSGPATYDFLQDASKLTLEKKIALLRESDEIDEPEMLQDMSKMLKSFRKVKYKAADQIAFERKMHHMLKDLFEHWLKVERLDVYDAGFPELDGELLSDDAIKLCRVNTSDPENAADGHTPMSILLQGMADEEQLRPDLPFLPAEFLESPLVAGKVYRLSDPEAADPQNIYLRNCFKLPNLLMLSEKELHILRKQVISDATFFRIMVDEWIDLCTETDDSNERLEYFRDKVVARAPLLQVQLSRNSIVRNCNKNAEQDLQYSVMLGEVPVSIIMQFYRENGVIADKTWNILQQQMKEDEDMQGRWPVMVLNCGGVVRAGKKEERERAEKKTGKARKAEPEKKIAPARKFIAVD